MEYKICVPVAIKSDDLYQNQQIITKIIEVKPDFIEFRFDFRYAGTTERRTCLGR